jgi:hypothetical protein
MRRSLYVGALSLAAAGASDLRLRAMVSNQAIPGLIMKYINAAATTR